MQTNLCVDEVASLPPPPSQPLSLNRSECHPTNHRTAIAWKSPKEATLPPVGGSRAVTTHQQTTTDGVPQPLSCFYALPNITNHLNLDSLLSLHSLLSSRKSINVIAHKKQTREPQTQPLLSPPPPSPASGKKAHVGSHFTPLRRAERDDSPMLPKFEVHDTDSI